MAGFEPANDGVKVRCLTAWLHPNIKANFTVGWIVGVEPTVSSATNWRFNQLSYTHHMARQKGLEPLTYCLEGSCSIQLSYWRKNHGADDGNRTHVTSLEGWSSTIELHPHY